MLLESMVGGMELNLSASWMFAGLIVSTVGFGLFLYGKKQTRLPQALAGIAMMIYPGFVASPALIYGIGVALCGGVWIAVRSGA
jgi:hypothetical protein